VYGGKWKFLHGSFVVKFALAVFVKTPGMSPVKTRLAAEIGTEQALKVYRKCLAAMEIKISQLAQNSLPKIQPYWAVAEEHAMGNDLWKSWPQIYQGSGELGERLDKVYSELLSDYDGVLLMGADSPLFPASEVENAIAWLGNHKTGAIIGPTQDGGYYLFGSRSPLAKSVWTSVPYSSPDTLESFLELLPSNIEKHFLESHWDVDTAVDLNRLKQEDPYFLKD
jgi:uncharacterized protein